MQGPGESPVTHHSQKQSDAQAPGHSKGSRFSGCGHPSRLAIHLAHVGGHLQSLVAAHAPGGHFCTAYSVHAPCRAPPCACAFFLRSLSTPCVTRAFRSCASFSWRAADSSGRELHQPLAVHSPSSFSPVSFYFRSPPHSHRPAEPAQCDAASYRSTPRHRGRPACCCAHGEPFQK